LKSKKSWSQIIKIRSGAEIHRWDAGLELSLLQRPHADYALPDETERGVRPAIRKGVAAAAILFHRMEKKSKRMFFEKIEKL